MEVLRTAVALMLRSMALSAQSAGQQRLLRLQQSAAVGGDVGELARLQDESGRLKSELRLLKDRFGDVPYADDPIRVPLVTPTRSASC